MIAHTGLSVSDYRRSKDFYRKALEPLGYTNNMEYGAKDNGGPGYRDYWPGYYAAFVHDPDGHNIEAVWYDYSKVK